MSFSLTVPLPPSVNALYRNVAFRGRVKTGAYHAWRKQCDLAGLRQKPIGGFPLFDRDFEIIICVPARMRGDVDNRAKSAIDVLVAWRIISDDRHTVSVTIRRVLDMPAGDCRITVRPASVQTMEAA